MVFVQPSIDDVQIRLDQAPTTSVSGGNQTICGTTANLNGTASSDRGRTMELCGGWQSRWAWRDQRH